MIVEPPSIFVINEPDTHQRDIKDSPRDSLDSKDTLFQIEDARVVNSAVIPDTFWKQRNLNDPKLDKDEGTDSMIYQNLLYSLMNFLDFLRDNNIAKIFLEQVEKISS